MASRALSSYVAALLLVAITMSLSYIVYQGVESLDPKEQAQQNAFSNQTLLLQGSPYDIARVSLNSSSEVVPVDLQVNGVDSGPGILYLEASGQYGSQSGALCLPGAITFFSVFAQTGGSLQVRSDGQTWIDGAEVSSLSVGPGWNEVMISNASSCSVLGPDGVTVSSTGPSVLGVPITGTNASSSFTMYIPEASPVAISQLLVVFSNGGYDTIA